MKAPKKQAHSRRVSDACTDFIACRHGSQELLTAATAQLLGKRHHNRRRNRARMHNRLFMNIIQLKRMACGGIDQHRTRNGGFNARTEDRSHSAGALFFDHGLDSLGPRKRCAK